MPSDVILIAEDDDILRALVATGLRRRGYVVLEADDGQTALDVSQAHPVDLYVLDRNLPGIDGLKLLRILRAKGVDVPVIFLTALSAINERIRGLDSGADDYMTKPVDVDELAARIRALIRRPAAVASQVLRFGDLALDLTNQRAWFKQEELELTAQDRDLLSIFMRKPSQIHSREALLDRLNMGANITPAAVEHAVSRLRKKLEAAGATNVVETVRGVGYRLSPREA